MDAPIIATERRQRVRLLIKLNIFASSLLIVNLEYQLHSWIFYISVRITLHPRQFLSSYVTWSNCTGSTFASKTTAKNFYPCKLHPSA